MLRIPPKTSSKHLLCANTINQTAHLGRFCHQAQPRRIPSPPELPPRCHTDAHRCQRSAAKMENQPFRPSRRSERGACVGRSYFDSSVGGFSHSLQQLVILWVKRDGEGTVNDSSCRDIRKKTFPSVHRATSRLTFYRDTLIPLMCVPKSILQTSSYCRTVASPALGV